MVALLPTDERRRALLRRLLDGDWRPAPNRNARLTLDRYASYGWLDWRLVQEKPATPRAYPVRRTHYRLTDRGRAWLAQHGGTA